VIRTVALGVVCLAGLGAIAAAARKSPPPRPAEIVFPVATGNRADRLPVNSNPEATTDLDKINVVYIPSIEEPQVIPPPPLPRPSTETRRPSAPDFVPRHWHDPHDLKASKAKPKSRDIIQAERRSPGVPNQVAEARSCRTEGLDPLLRKLNLSPSCEP
jgi:hypothetical protein